MERKIEQSEEEEELNENEKNEISATTAAAGPLHISTAYI